MNRSSGQAKAYFALIVLILLFLFVMYGITLRSMAQDLTMILDGYKDRFITDVFTP